MLNGAIVIIGASGLIAQLILLRELITSFLGNELVIGIILSNWVLAQGCGAYLFARMQKRIEDAGSMIFFLQLIFSVALPAAVYMSRFLHPLLGLGPGQAPGLWQGVWFSLFVVSCVSFTHGALFSVMSQAVSLNRVYAWESLGTMMGGIAFTYLCLVYLDAFLLALAVSFFNLVLSFVFLSSKRASFYIRALCAGLLVLLCLLLISWHGRINLYSAGRAFPNSRLIEYRNSAHGTIAVTRTGGQYTFYYNGTPVVTSPNPNSEFIEEFSHIPLLSHHAPGNILVIGGGAGGFLSELLKYPQVRVTYIELDPLLIESIRKYPTELTQREFADERVVIRHEDGRHFLKEHAAKFDLIFIGSPAPSELSLNRFFTTEFFRLAKEKLSSKGIIAFYLAGSLSYLGPELKEINGSILESARNVYPWIRIVPGDNTIFMVSNDVDLDSETSDELIRRMDERRIKTGLIHPAYLRYRLDKKWEQWFTESMKGPAYKENRDLSPFAVFGVTRLWNRQFSGAADHWKLSMFLAVVAACIIWMLIIRKPYQRVLGLVLATTGFYGMLMSLALILSFQAFNGYLYRQMGLIISFFMAGSSLSGFMILRLRPAPGQALKQMIAAESSLVFFALTAAALIFGFSALLSGAGIVFYLLALAAGFLVGWEFVLSASLYGHKDPDTGLAPGFLYASDLAGSYCAGIAGTAFLLPLFGVGGCFIVLVLLKLFTAVLLAFYGLKKRFFL